MNVIDMPQSKATAAVWRPLDKGFITGHEDGSVSQIDFDSGDAVRVNKKHSHQINDIQVSADSTMFVTSSKDTSAKVSGAGMVCGEGGREGGCCWREGRSENKFE